MVLITAQESCLSTSETWALKCVTVPALHFRQKQRWQVWPPSVLEKYQENSGGFFSLDRSVRWGICWKHRCAEVTADTSHRITVGSYHRKNSTINHNFSFLFFCCFVLFLYLHFIFLYFIQQFICVIQCF